MSATTKLLWVLVWLMPAFCFAQSDTLGQLESLGVQLLSTLLSPAASSTTSSSSTSSSTSTSSSSTTSSTTSSSLSLNRPVTTSSSPSATATPAAATKDNKNRNLALILGTVLGFLVVLLLAALLWMCCFRRGRKHNLRNREKNIDDDEIEPYNPLAPQETSYVTRIESWHEPRNSRNNSRQPLAGPLRSSTSRVSIIQRDVPDRYNSPPQRDIPDRYSSPSQRDIPDRYSSSGPLSTVPGTVPIPPPHRLNQAPRHNSQYGLIQNENPFDDPKLPYADQPERRSMDDASRNSSKYPGYVPYRSTQSLVERKPIPQNQAVIERTPTPLFGSGKTPGESAKRHSSDPSNAATSYFNHGPNGHSAVTNGTSRPWVPPKNPGRRESIPGSPLAHEFEFGFDDRNRRMSREKVTGGSSNGMTQDAHHRF